MAHVLWSQHLSRIKIPLGGEKVYKDECIFTFDTPESSTGLYVCMNTFLGLGKKHVETYYRKTGNAVFLHLRRIRKEIHKPATSEPEAKPTKLAIGVEGGFKADEKQYEFEEHNSITILPEWTEIALPNQDLPDMVQLSTASILAADDPLKAEAAAAMAGTWDGEKRLLSKHATNLLQLDNGKKIPPSGWMCEQCDMTTNLWLNLTDGSILCGRKFFDGSGGRNHAVDYYQTSRYPLAVKLGTITSEGGDVYSYDEDDMVEDPYLAKHLAHFGINIASLEKTEKTMIELEIDINQKFGEWDVIQEAGSKLQPVYGPGYTGMRNLGNSCYMNSVMQVVFTIPDFQKRYCAAVGEVFDNAPADPLSDFNFQMTKLGNGLLSGDYSKQLPEDVDTQLQAPSGIRPNMFKTLIGRGHPEFSTKRQQDAEEFFLHLISVIERNSRGIANPTECFKFQVEERVQCVQTGKVKYTNREDYMLALPIPMESMTNRDEVTTYEVKKIEMESQGQKLDPKDLVRPRIPLSSCIASFADDETVEDFYSSALQAKTLAKKTTKLATFPDYLMMQLKKFTVAEDWTPKKLDVSVDVPDQLDLSGLRGSGLQPGEESLPQEEESATEQEIQMDMAVVSQLVEMGFALEGCKKAVYHTNNSGIEAAMNWVMEHMGDPDFEVPLHVPSAKKTSSAFTPNEDGLAMIMSMGFTREQATKSLKATDNSVERAADWIFNHTEELDTSMETEGGTASAGSSQQFRDGSGKYRLLAFISHMGTSTMVGHYVCHIRKDGRWVIFNDEKVALSEHPPKDLAYLYVYERV